MNNSTLRQCLLRLTSRSHNSSKESLKGDLCMNRLFGPMGFLVIFLMFGCQGTNEVVNLKVYGLAPSPDENHGTLSVAIQDFEDLRNPKGDLGQRTHFWGGHTRFTIWDGDIGSGVANAAAEYLEHSGWQVQQTGATGSSTADVSLKGKIREFTASAKSGFGFTEFTVDTIIEYHVENRLDGSIERITVGSGGKDTVAVFGPQDMEKLVYAVLQENFDELLDETVVKGKTLKRKE